MHAFLDSLVPVASSVAARISRRLLDEHYQAVRREILVVFDRYPDPLERAKELLLSVEHEGSAQERARTEAILDKIACSFPDCEKS